VEDPQKNAVTDSPDENSKSKKSIASLRPRAITAPCPVTMRSSCGVFPTPAFIARVTGRLAN